MVECGVEDEWRRRYFKYGGSNQIDGPGREVTDWGGGYNEVPRYLGYKDKGISISQFFLSHLRGTLAR